ncbi:hypothetical protein [Terricaulis sp.]|uniref:hypothetical protein n=1 Tax=Terricaulis sp. TaxID=2768686 RepID=UPI0037836B38
MVAIDHTRASWRLRSATLVASALIVASACVLLWWFSRVIAAYEAPAFTGVAASVERPAPPRLQARRTAPPPAVRSNAAVPVSETTMPVSAAMLARTLACTDTHLERRPVNCPRSAEPHWGEAPAVAPSTGFGEDPLRLDRGYSVAERATLLTPSCRRDGGPPGMVSACMTIGRDPPPPSRSAEEICETGGIGPCHPPAYREEDVVHLAHTN